MLMVTLVLVLTMTVVAGGRGDGLMAEVVMVVDGEGDCGMVAMGTVVVAEMGWCCGLVVSQCWQCKGGTTTSMVVVTVFSAPWALVR